VLESGVDVARFGGQASNVIIPLDYGEHFGTDAAVFARVQQSLSLPLEFHGGVRYDHNSFSGGIVVPEVGGAWKPGDRTTISVSVARGFRNPTIRELYLFPAPNPSLEPEHVWNSQATIQVRAPASVSASATVYHADVDNLIVTTGRFPNLALRNSGRALNRGVEGRVAWGPAGLWQVNAGYAYLRSSNLAPLVPAHKLTYAHDLRWPACIVSFSGISVGSRWADTGHTATLARYTTVALRATVPAGPRAAIFGVVDNLLNETYEVVPGYPMPGTNVAAGLTWTF
jgi:outer membrane receptor protein involved in Fe transport